MKDDAWRMEANSRTCRRKQLGQIHHPMFYSQNLDGVRVKPVEKQIPWKTAEYQTANAGRIQVLAQASEFRQPFDAANAGQYFFMPTRGNFR